ncbi:hypothetical protein XA68_15363 [Ophiocordyceps unilateralis]|uniref:Major facilitator superfamily (MFS) profile domain-containing protein n=1 Tax=Ophiocordyceps unilateralis TaxID=268505 RepID=A0A2A9PMD7_OPHUN|nr:hypothetical protein XA68_15363 [Ophiocordyceps unilateralis]
MPPRLSRLGILLRGSPPSPVSLVPSSFATVCSRRDVRTNRMANRGNLAHADPPPGTVELLAEHGADGKDGEVVLIPAPSDDPNDPLRWPMWRKCLHFGLLVAMTTAIFTSLSIQTIFWTQMEQDMINVTIQDLANAQAVQLVGLAVGCVVFMPPATKYGRRSVYIIVMAIAAISAWWSAVMKTVPELFVANFLIGISGAVNQTAIAMTIHDIWFVHQRGTANGMFFAGLMTGSFLCPMAAGVQGIKDGWRVSYATLAAAMTVLTVIFVIALEETKFIRPDQEAIPKDKQDMFKLESFQSELARSATDKASKKRGGCLQKARLQFVTKSDESLWKIFYYPALSWWFPQVIFASLQLGSSICWLVVLGSMISIVFSAPPYNFDAAGLGYMYAGPCVGAIFGALYGGPLVDKAIVWLSRRNHGWFEPEMRLWLYPIPALAMAGGLVLFGVSAGQGMHFVIPSVGGALFSFSFGAISDIATALVLDSFPAIVPQTFVAITFFRNAISMVGPFSVTPWSEAMGTTNMFIVAAAISLAVNALALPLGIWGKKGRAAVAARYHRLADQSV